MKCSIVYDVADLNDLERCFQLYRYGFSLKIHLLGFLNYTLDDVKQALQDTNPTQFKMKSLNVNVKDLKDFIEIFNNQSPMNRDQTIHNLKELKLFNNSMDCLMDLDRLSNVSKGLKRMSLEGGDRALPRIDISQLHSVVPNLIELRITKYQVPMKPLISLINKLDQLQKLVIIGNQFISDCSTMVNRIIDVNNLFHCLSVNKTIKILHFDANMSLHMEIISNFLNRNSMVEEFRLKLDNLVFDGTFDEYPIYNQSIVSITSLWESDILAQWRSNSGITNITIDKHNQKSLLQSVPKYHLANLTTLNLTIPTDYQIIKLNPPTLTKLQLIRYICKENEQDLYDALKCNSNLLEVSIYPRSHYTVTIDPIIDFLESNHSSIKVFSIYSAKILIQNYEPLTQSLAKNKTLKSFTLESIELSIGGDCTEFMLNIVQILLINSILEHLSLLHFKPIHCHVSTDTLEYLNNALRKNNQIRSLNLNCKDSKYKKILLDYFIK
ncbi:hypothetical protein DLAC_09248 [Tieghemostelium lacteum]|uniref:Uncharacterized protein n=1 Tax=Tieghemostelium lacteum TaxID=361077 RepID=A0A151Z9L1_TIELA|nr:hypothetical protein DLAC_09248 [Tieghemostelium lacteum]|eukprot:KYQ90619.1 hypothetical protein DLAC_09248 [Tieghemostelium lacteum]